MNRVPSRRLSAILALVICCLSTAQQTPAQEATQNSAQVKALFADPPREYSTGPLWTWNDMLTEEQIVSTLRDLAAQKVRQVWVHPRPGMMTVYLSDDWFNLWRAAVEEAKRLDMNVWIYDENSYPSGFAGGLVPEAMPESRGRGLVFREEKSPGPLGDDVVGVYRPSDTGYENVTRPAKSSSPLPEGRYLVAHVNRAPDAPWTAGRCYVDLIYPGVTEKFLEITLEAYRREVGEEFGRHVPGVFTDEPQLRPAGGLAWTDDLPEQFQKRWGYDLLEHLPCLVSDAGDWKRVKHNYFQLVLELFIERWGKPYYEYCEKNGLELTGHYWEHEWPIAIAVPDTMAMYAWQQRPGIDVLFNRYSEGPHAQFGNVRAVKELSSVANQLGGRRTISETYAGTGWEARFEDLKRIGDWESALGVNTLNECISFVSIRGVRKGDYPQSLSYHEPWWEAYHLLAGYFTRLSAVLSSGRQVNPTLVIEPTTTAWIYQSGAHLKGLAEHLTKLGDSFQLTVTDLAKSQVEYDIGCENIIADHGSTDGAAFVVGDCRYRTVVLPEFCENLNSPTMNLLEEYLAAGGTVLCCGPPPSLVDGSPSDRGGKAAQSDGWRQIESSELPQILLEASTDGFAIRRAPDDSGLLYSQRRHLDDGELVFLANTSDRSHTSGTLTANAGGAERWVLETGAVKPHPFTKTAKGIQADFDLPPCGSLLLFLPKKDREPPKTVRLVKQALEPSGPMEIVRTEPNVLTLDYVDVTAGGQTHQSIHCRKASAFVFKQHGLDRNPWFHAIQFGDEFNRMTFPPPSGFEATYRFTIEGDVPSDLAVVIERPDLYTVTCNGRPISAADGRWWLDRSFGRIDVARAAKQGENAITIHASPFTLFHEIEAAYVLGDFSLKPAESGFVIVPESPLDLSHAGGRHSTAPNGRMWLSGGIGFRPELSPGRDDDGDPFIVFDLGRPHSLEAIKIWNYNEASWTKLGVKELEITASLGDQADSFPISLGRFTVAEAGHRPVQADGAGSGPSMLTLDAKPVRFVKFDILSNHNGVTFPTTDQSQYHAFVGISEVQFFGTTSETEPTSWIAKVGIEEVSGELSIPEVCDRRAEFLVDESGLALSGWNEQGMPFYPNGVAYRQDFEVPRPGGGYQVRLPNWHGSVVKIVVNGRTAGYIGYRPWQCDVTEFITAGTNNIEVIVIGTLRNTLGPHHAGDVFGLISPHSFLKAPDNGPPPGKDYSTVGYGLMEPFVLEHLDKVR